MRALLGERSVIDHQHGIAAADELICLDEQLCFQRLGIPYPARDEMVQLIVFRQLQTPPPSAECSCGRQDRSVLSRKEDTSVAAPYAPTEPEMALESVQAPSASPSPWSTPPKADHP